MPTSSRCPLPNKRSCANDYEFIEKWWRDASPEYVIPREVMESVKETFRQPGVVTAAINYYRHTMNPANHDPALAVLQRQVATMPDTRPSVGAARHERPPRAA